MEDETKELLLAYFKYNVTQKMYEIPVSSFEGWISQIVNNNEGDDLKSYLHYRTTKIRYDGLRWNRWYKSNQYNSNEKLEESVDKFIIDNREFCNELNDAVIEFKNESLANARKTTFGGHTLVDVDANSMDLVENVASIDIADKLEENDEAVSQKTADKISILLTATVAQWATEYSSNDREEACEVLVELDKNLLSKTTTGDHKLSSKIARSVLQLGYKVLKDLNNINLS